VEKSLREMKVEGGLFQLVMSEQQLNGAGQRRFLEESRWAGCSARLQRAILGIGPHLSPRVYLTDASRFVVNSR
jgi:hypothetical protein